MANDEMEKAWIKIVSAIIVGGATVLAAMLPLYCSSQRRLEQTTQTADSESDSLRKQLANLESQVHKCEAEKAALAQKPVEALNNPDPEPVASNTEVANHNASTPEEKGIIFQTPYYSLNITSVRKAGSSIRVSFVVEAILEEKIKLSYGWCSDADGIYLLNEDGERLEPDYNNEGTKPFTKKYGSTELLPDTKLRGNFLFLSKSESTGSRFTLVITECEPQLGAQRAIKGLNLS